MLSHCDEKHSEMMWRECSSCPQRDGKPALAFVCSFVPVCVCVCACWLFSGCSSDGVCLLPAVQTHIDLHAKSVGFAPVVSLMSQVTSRTSRTESITDARLCQAAVVAAVAWRRLPARLCG